MTWRHSFALHWLAGALIAAGYLTTDDRTLFGDPDLAAVVTSIIGVACGLIAELWYWAARKLGWQT